jgi:outer membrane protein
MDSGDVYLNVNYLLSCEREKRYMKNFVYLVTAAVVFVFVWSTGSFAADKIGVINLRQIMKDSTAGKKAADDFKKFYENKTKDIKLMEKEVKSMKNELDRQKTIMTQNALSEKESAYQKKMRDYQLLVNDTKEELKRRDLEMTQKLMPEIMKAVRSLAVKGKYNLIIDVATMPVAYYAKEDDITAKVIEEYNRAAR